MLKKNTDYLKVPDNYFSELQKNVMSGIEPNLVVEKKRNYKRNLFLATLMTTAAAAILIIFMVNVKNGSQMTTNSEHLAFNQADYFLFLQDMNDEADTNDYLMSDNY